MCPQVVTSPSGHVMNPIAGVSVRCPFADRRRRRRPCAPASGPGTAAAAWRLPRVCAAGTRVMRLARGTPRCGREGVLDRKGRGQPRNGLCGRRALNAGAETRRAPRPILRSASRSSHHAPQTAGSSSPSSAKDPRSIPPQSLQAMRTETRTYPTARSGFLPDARITAQWDRPGRSAQGTPNGRTRGCAQALPACLGARPAGLESPFCAAAARAFASPAPPSRVDSSTRCPRVRPVAARANMLPARDPWAASLHSVRSA